MVYYCRKVVFKYHSATMREAGKGSQWGSYEKQDANSNGDLGSADVGRGHRGGDADHLCSRSPLDGENRLSDFAGGEVSANECECGFALGEQTLQLLILYSRQDFLKLRARRVSQRDQVIAGN